MATRTFTTAGVNNLWSNAANWDTAPGDDDTVVIPTGQTCEFDVDTSLWANGINGITITGTLKLTRTTGTYYLKMKAATTIAGAGTFDCGASALDPIPFAAKHTITGGAAWYINGAAGLTMTVYAAEPTVKTVLLTALEPIGETVLAVDTSVVGDIWADGDTVCICQIKMAVSEVRVIAAGGIAAGTITITAGLTAAKNIGAILVLISRNVKFIGVGAAAYVMQNFTSGKLAIAGGSYTTAYRILNACIDTSISGGAVYCAATNFLSCTGMQISGGVFVGASGAFGLNQCNSATISGGTFSAYSYAWSSCLGLSVSGGSFTCNDNVMYNCVGSVISGGSFFNNASCVYLGMGTVITGGTFTNNTNGLNRGAAEIKNATYSSNTQDMNVSVFTAFNVSLGSTIEVTGYTSLAEAAYSESFDHDTIAGAFRAWTRGGITTKQATTYPTGYTYSMQTVLESATIKGYWQREVVVGAGSSINITMYLRKSALMTYLPRVIVFNKAATDPLAGGAGLYTFTMTDSADTWEDDLYTYTNATTEDVTIVIRCQGMNASGNLFSYVGVEVINVDLTTTIANLAVVDTVVDGIVVQITNLLAQTVEGTLDIGDVLRLLLAVTTGRASGGGTSLIKFRDVANTKDRVTEVVDGYGNRSGVTLDGD